MDDDFPIDESFLLSFPCCIVRSEDGDGFARHAIGQNQYAIMVLTDEDLLNGYRRSIGMPEQGAARFVTAHQFLAALLTLPPQVTHLAFDVRRHDSTKEEQSAQLWRIGHVRKQIAAQIGQS